MSLNPESESIVSLRQAPNGAEAPLLEPAAPERPAAVITPAYNLPAYPAVAQPEPLAAPVPAPAPRARRRLGWLAPVAIALVGLIASGTLGWLFYSTLGQRDGARHELASTQATLASTQHDLATAKDAAAAQGAVDTYVTMFVVNNAIVQTDFANFERCSSFGACRTAIQSELTDMQAFQSARASAVVPSALSNADAMIRDALSAGIAADQRVISGMDNGNLNTFKDGWNKLEAAMLSLAKAQTALGANLK
jgi:hypothetical protein